ncbi:hypothetical protein IGI04_016328 [Brassica rapa subsp. trilocularis]|uniref:Protein phosphatase n=1 Tax=Brassica rapa subsp. trilocularis TaxID=1813537 RepID=A0ABQ7MVB6_BRACM|nr:hypothetical protein IGI04_016328 [Brassica rapa subsp. trilocularis]
MLEEVSVLNIGNVGDCGLKLLSDVSQIIFSTTPQEYYFDCPYQLSSQGPAQTYQDASKGDVIVMGSYGGFFR